MKKFIDRYRWWALAGMMLQATAQVYEFHARSGLYFGGEVMVAPALLFMVAAVRSIRDELHYWWHSHDENEYYPNNSGGMDYDNKRVPAEPE